jgi:diguanylate cyclase (GGDEF)-like protein
MDGFADRAPPAETLAAALIDSRARWRDFALLAADLVFETDAAGCLTFLAPEQPLGHRAEAWLGQPASALLAGPAPGPFGARQAMRGAKAWASRADGTLACLEFAVMPHLGGLRGTARDVTAEERMGEVAARALRRATALGRLLRLGQRQAGAAAALEAMMAALPAALAGAGAALLLPEATGWRIARHGDSAAAIDLPAARLPPPGAGEPACGRLALATTDSGPALLAWRAEGHGDFDADDRDLLAALAMPIAALHAEALRQRALTEAAQCDALTGLLNRRGFTAALAERLRRGGGGALVFIDLDGLKPINDQFGHEAGDAALRGMAARLRQAAGPQDLAARLGGDEFCLWMDGVANAEAAGTRATPLGAAGPAPGWPAAGPAALRASIGIALPAPAEDAAALLTRADAAMYVVKRGRQGERRR